MKFEKKDILGMKDISVDEIICKATLADAHVKLVVDFEIRKVADGMICARGRTEQVTVKTPEMETIFSIPQEIRSALGY